MIGLHKAYDELSKHQQKEFRLHLTLLDIHPTALARDLVIMLLLDDLVSSRSKSKTETEEIKATAFYTFGAALMPPVCFERYT
jgi:hypothetical protein